MSYEFPMEQVVKLFEEFRAIDGVGVCKVYFLNGVPFTFDEDIIPEDDTECINAEEKPHFSNEDIYKGSSYLLEEGFTLDSLVEDINDHLIDQD